MKERKALEISQDRIRDTVTIDGVMYSADLFREYGLGPTKGRLFKVVQKRDDGTVTVKTWAVNDAEFEQWHASQEEKRLREVLEVLKS
jgi:hypothetical protein